MKTQLRVDGEPQRTASSLRVTATLFGLSLCAMVLNACGGSGGTGSSSNAPVIPVPVPTSPTVIVQPTPASTATTKASSLSSALSSANCVPGVSVQSERRAQAVSTSPPFYSTNTIDSFPQGMAVYVNGSSIGVTPMSVLPQPNNLANVVTIGTSTQSVNYCYSQTAAASRTLYYNKSTDTHGSIGSVSSSSVARNVLSFTGATDDLIRHELRTAPEPAIANDRILVKFRSAMLQNGSRSILGSEHQAGVAGMQTLGPQNGSLISRLVRIPTSGSLEEVREKFASDPAVAEIDPVHFRYPLSVTPVYPNDPQFASGDLKQWDLYQINAPLAWGITTGSPSVAIAIIDTGYDTHAADLKSKVQFSESVLNGVTDTSAQAAQDTDGHGTNVSGIAAAATNNGLGVAGVGYNVVLQEYRVFPNGNSSANATTTDEAQAIYDAVLKGAKVISLSLGGTQSATQASGGIDAAEYDAIEYAISKNVTVVAAAGNERSSTITSIDYPAAYPGVIAVGASALNDSAHVQSRSSATEYVASYSNAGPGLALVAPGGDPNSANDSDPLHWVLNLDTTTPAMSANTCSTPSACLALFAGTSQATPHVSAAAALMLSLQGTLTPSQIKTILMATADDIQDPRQGAGRLNVYRAVAAVAGISTTPPTFQNFVAFAYTNSGSATPRIADATFINGVPVASDGTFRLSDITSSASSYRIAVWADVNGDGIIDAGDFIGVSGSCTNAAPCSATGLSVSPVPNGYTLP